MRKICGLPAVPLAMSESSAFRLMSEGSHLMKPGGGVLLVSKSKR